MIRKIQHKSSSFVFIAIVAMMCSVLIGCGIDRVNVDSRTGGLSLNMEVRQGEDSVAVYDVRTDGTLEFAGGKTAILGGVDWTDSLTDDEIAEIRHLIDSLGWYETDLATADESSALTYSIRVRSAQGHRRFRVHGLNPRIEPVQAVLEQAAGRRNRAVLDALPRPSLEESRSK